MTRTPFEIGQIVYCKITGDPVRVEGYTDNPKAFEGINLRDGDYSSFWEISKFSQRKPYVLKYEKEFYVTGAIYRMLRTKKIGADTAKALLQTRSKMRPDLARSVVELWFTSWPIREAYGLTPQSRMGAA